MREMALAALLAAIFEQIPLWLLVVILTIAWFVSAPGSSRRAVLIRLRCWVAQVRRAMRDHLAEAGFGALCVRLSAFLRGITAAASLKPRGESLVATGRERELFRGYPAAASLKQLRPIVQLRMRSHWHRA